MKKQKHHPSNPKLFHEAWELYTHSFPTDEQRPLNLHLKAIEDNRFCPYVYTSEQEALLAICFYWNFSDFLYLEHFSIKPEFRNKGIGSKIISSLITDKQPIVIEIETPTDKQQKQRLKFYERNQFQQTDYTFKQLKYKADNRDVFLQLLCSTNMNNDFFEKFQTTIYNELQAYCATE